MPTSDEILVKFKAAYAKGDEEGMRSLKAAYLRVQEEEKQVNRGPQGQGDQSALSPAGAAGAPEKSVSSVGKDIAVATGLGAALGAVTPELTTAAGAAMLAWPPTAPAAPYVIGLGRAMRAERMGMAIAGAVGGAASETAGQAAEAAGAGPKTAFAARAVGGVVPAVGGAAAKAVVSAFIPRSMKAAWQAFRGMTGGVERETAASVESARKLLSSDRFSTVPQHDLHSMLLKGVDADLKASERAASQLLAEARQKAAFLEGTDRAGAARALSEGEEQAAALRADAKARAYVLDKATAGQLARSERVGRQAEEELHKLGTPHEISDIGNTLRGKVTTQHQGLLAQREQQYQTLKKTRDDLVTSHEAAGKFLDAEPAMKELKQELATKLLNTKKGRAAAEGKADATEPGVLSAYQKVYDAISNRRVQTGVTEEGTPTYQTFKTTFEALDHVRRKLGDAAYSSGEAEGYGALGQGIAKSMYQKISKIQQEYVGGTVQKELQGVYAEGSEKLAKFNTQTGRYATAVDRMDGEVFTKDPASIPGRFFQSQQSVKDLVELTADPVLVAGAARSYVARQLAGKSEKQVAGWIESNSDWMREVPGLQQSAKQYAGRLKQIEGYEASAARRVGVVGKAKGDLLFKDLPKAVEGAKTGAEGKAASILKEGEKARGEVLAFGETGAAGVRKQAEETAAKALPKGDSPPDTVRKLLTGSSLDGLKHTARWIAGHPGGQEALEGSVRVLLAQESPAKLSTLWNERLSEVLKEGRLLPRVAFEKLDADVQAVMRSPAPVAEKKRLVQRMVAGALAGAGAGGAQVVRGALQ